MSKSRVTIIIKATEFMNDFKSLTSSSAERTKIFNSIGLSHNVFNNWRVRMNSSGEARVNDSTFKKLCDISGLNYSDYFISNTSFRKNPATPKVARSVKTTKTQRLKNGVKVTTYTAEPKPNVSDTSATSNTTCGDIFTKCANFKTHMEIYRKLLGIHTSTLVDTYNIKNYSDLEKGHGALSFSTYFYLSLIFMDAYNKLDSSPLKSLFTDLATTYNDIYIKVSYFGDDTK